MMVADSALIPKVIGYQFGAPIKDFQSMVTAEITIIKNRMKNEKTEKVNVNLLASLPGGLINTQAANIILSKEDKIAVYIPARLKLIVQIGSLAS